MLTYKLILQRFYGIGGAMVDRTRWVDWAGDARSSANYAADQLKLDFAVDLERRMEQMGISRADLARRLQTSAAAVTMALRGDANLTIERMVRMARALDATVHIHVAPAAAGVRWFDVIAQQKPQVEHASMWARSSGHG
jgi:antitoxin component HigA of HigAB toxin-antitoxin module